MKQRRGYANLTNDYMFKRVFGSEECKDILITFLNRIVGNGDIEDVTFQNTEHLGPTADDRRAVFDITVRTKSGEEYIIEMQLAQQEYFRLKPVRFIAVVNFPLTHSSEWDDDRYFSSYRLKEELRICHILVSDQKFLMKRSSTVCLKWRNYVNSRPMNIITIKIRRR